MPFAYHSRMASTPTSLWARHRRRIDVPALLGVCALLLAAGYLLPFMEIKKLVFFASEYSLLQSIGSMWTEGEYFLAVVIFLFSVLFPIVKLVMLGWVWVWPLDDQRRQTYLRWLSYLGKWSMLDVFVVAILVVLTKAAALMDARPQVGLYVFAGAVFASMVTALMIERIAGGEA